MEGGVHYVSIWQCSWGDSNICKWFRRWMLLVACGICVPNGYCHMDSLACSGPLNRQSRDCYKVSTRQTACLLLSCTSLSLALPEFCSSLQSLDCCFIHTCNPELEGNIRPLFQSCIYPQTVLNKVAIWRFQSGAKFWCGRERGAQGESEHASQPTPVQGNTVCYFINGYTIKNKQTPNWNVLYESALCAQL